MAVARKWPCKHHMTTGYRGNRGSTIIRKLWEGVFYKVCCNGYLTPQQGNCKKRCFLCSLCRGFIPRTSCHTYILNKNLVLGPRWGLTPRLTGRLTIGCNVTLTLTYERGLCDGEFKYLHHSAASHGE
jgi:hypothetical protein